MTKVQRRVRSCSRTKRPCLSTWKHRAGGARFKATTSTSPRSTSSRVAPISNVRPNTSAAGSSAANSTATSTSLRAWAWSRATEPKRYTATRSGQLRSVARMISATSGSFGISLAIVCYLAHGVKPLRAQARGAAIDACVSFGTGQREFFVTTRSDPHPPRCSPPGWSLPMTDPAEKRPRFSDHLTTEARRTEF